MGIGDNDRPAIGGKGIFIVDGDGCIKILIDDMLKAHVDRQVDVVADRGPLQQLVHLVVQRCLPYLASEIVVELRLNTRRRVAGNVIADQGSQRRLGIMALVPTARVGGKRLRQQDAVAVEDAPTHRSAIRQTRTSIMNIALYLLRHNNLPVDQSSTERNKQNDKKER